MRWIVESSLKTFGILAGAAAIVLAIAKVGDTPVDALPEFTPGLSDRRWTPYEGVSRAAPSASSCLRSHFVHRYDGWRLLTLSPAP
jgi:hypothetical protein